MYVVGCQAAGVVVGQGVRQRRTHLLGAVSHRAPKAQQLEMYGGARRACLEDGRWALGVSAPGWRGSNSCRAVAR